MILLKTSCHKISCILSHHVSADPSILLCHPFGTVLVKLCISEGNVSSNKKWARREGGRLVWNTLHMLCSVLTSKRPKMFVVCTLWPYCAHATVEWNLLCRIFFWPVTICIPVPSHKPSHCHCWRVKTPSKLKWIVFNCVLHGNYTVQVTGVL